MTTKQKITKSTSIEEVRGSLGLDPDRGANHDERYNYDLAITIGAIITPSRIVALGLRGSSAHVVADRLATMAFGDPISRQMTPRLHKGHILTGSLPEMFNELEYGDQFWQRVGILPVYSTIDDEVVRYGDGHIISSLIKANDLSIISGIEAPANGRKFGPDKNVTLLAVVERGKVS